MAKHEFATPPIAYNLASSTGPRWTLQEVVDLGTSRPDIASLPLGYGPPEGSAGLRTQIARLHRVDPARVVATTGSSEALTIIFCILAAPGRDVVLPDLAYPAYEALANAWGLGARHYELSAANEFAHDPAAILASVDAQTVAVVVNTPHNPTGAVMPRDDIQWLAASLADRSVPLIVDEVYHPLYYGSASPSAAGLPNTIVTGDLSKALSMPGLRTGWLIDADDARRARMVDARSYFTISGSPVLELIATHALRNQDAVIARLERAANANLRRLVELVATNPQLSWTPPRGGTTAFPGFVDRRDSRPFCEVLATEGVLVAPGDCFGRPEHIRIGLAQEEGGFADACSIIGRVLEFSRR